MTLCSVQESKQPLLKLVDILLTDAGKVPMWLIRVLKRAFFVTVFTIITVVLRVYISHGGPGKHIFHK